MNANAQRNFQEADQSGVHRTLKIEHAMEEKRQQYADIIESLEKHDLLGPLVRGGFHDGVRQEGYLRSMIYQFNKFYDQMFQNHADFLDKEMALHSLEQIFERTMKEIIGKWARLAAQQVEWNSLCAALEKYFYDMAGLFGVEKQMNFYTRNWFDTYARNQLTADALASYQQLAYLGTTGQAHQQNEVVKKIRGKISAIDKKLARMPMKEEHYPAFSRNNPSQKVWIEPGNLKSPSADHIIVTTTKGRDAASKAEKYPSPWVEPPIAPQPHPKKKSWLGKLWGKIRGK